MVLEKLNRFGQKRVPFFFIVNFDKTECWAWTLNSLPKEIRFFFDGIEIAEKTKSWDSNHVKTSKGNPVPSIEVIEPVSYQEYLAAFNRVIEEMKSGNSYLLNLTFPTEVKIDSSLTDYYERSDAKFKVLLEDSFISFSPERFIKIKNDKIFTYPMKGTSSIALDPDGDGLLNDKKEQAEHLMVVDLLRNDLNRVSSNVSVEKFRYLEKINKGNDHIWQTSSEITGKLEKDWHSRIGGIIRGLLPAGSISGTPKVETIKIINKVEAQNREFYTGIAGYYDGQMLDSCVLIRYMVLKNGKVFYHSGGGITVNSDPKKEYQEMLDKIYFSPPLSLGSAQLGFPRQGKETTSAV